MRHQLPWAFRALQEDLLWSHPTQRLIKLRHGEIARNTEEGQETVPATGEDSPVVCSVEHPPAVLTTEESNGQ